MRQLGKVICTVGLSWKKEKPTRNLNNKLGSFIAASTYIENLMMDLTLDD